MDTPQECITSTRSNVRPPGGGRFEMKLRSVGSVETVRLKRFQQHASCVVQQDGCGSGLDDNQ